jgi:hypothetical protein
MTIRRYMSKEMKKDFDKEIDTRVKLAGLLYELERS